MAFSATFAYNIVDRYTTKIKAMRKATQRFRDNVKVTSGSIQKLGSKLGRMSTKLANLRTGFAAMMAGRGLKAAVTESINFERAMNKVAAVTQATASQMIQLRKEARLLGLTTKFSSVEAAQGMAMLGQRGFKTIKILDTLPSVLTMATAGEIELAEAAKMVTGTMYAFELGAEKASHIADIYALTAANTASAMEDLNGAMVNAAPLAHAAGISFEETAALIGIMSNKNIMGSASGTLLMNAFRNLVKPSNDAIKVLKKFGFKKNEVTDASGQIVDFTNLLELFHKRGIRIQEIFRIFQLRGAKGTAALMGQTKAVRLLIEKYKEQIGAAEKMADVMLWGIVRPSVEAKSAWEGMKEAIGKAIEPITKKVFKMVTAFARFVAQRPKLAKFIGVFLIMTSVVLGLVTLIGVLLASLAGVILVLGPLGAGLIGVGAAGASGFGAMAVAVNAALWPILLIVLAITAIVTVVALLITYWDEIVAYIKKTPGWVLGILAVFFPLVGSMALMIKYWDKIKKAIKIVGTYLKAFFLTIWDDILARIAKVVAVWKAIKGFFGGGDKTELSSTAISPGDLGTDNKIRVENVITGSIDINDRSGMASVPTTGGGIIPLNLAPVTGYSMP